MSTKSPESELDDGEELGDDDRSDTDEEHEQCMLDEACSTTYCK